MQRGWESEPGMGWDEMKKLEPCRHKIKRRKTNISNEDEAKAEKSFAIFARPCFSREFLVERNFQSLSRWNYSS
jgi:hypothetical protein